VSTKIRRRENVSEEDLRMRRIAGSRPPPSEDQELRSRRWKIKESDPTSRRSATATRSSPRRSRPRRGCVRGSTRRLGFVGNCTPASRPARSRRRHESEAMRKSMGDVRQGEGDRHRSGQERCWMTNAVHLNRGSKTSGCRQDPRLSWSAPWISSGLSPAAEGARSKGPPKNHPTSKASTWTAWR